MCVEPHPSMYVGITLMTRANCVLCAAVVVLAVLADVLKLVVQTSNMNHRPANHYQVNQKPVKLVCVLQSLVLPAQV